MSDAIILLGIASSELEATIWRDTLQQEGVPAFVRNRDPLAPAGMPLFFSKYEVFVPARDEKRARWIIGDAIEPEFTPENIAEEEQEPAARD